jgi:hypothetical protein
VFLRKNLILWELSCEMVQECDSKGFIGGRVGPVEVGEVSQGLVGTITTHVST